MKYINDKNLSESIKIRIIDAIKLSGLSQTEIANKIGVSSSTISDYIHKNKLPSLETFALLCEALDVSSNEILGLD